jgi:hypothetical protein
MKRTYRLVHRIARAGAVEAVASAPEGYIVTIAAPTRSTAANARMWALLGEVSLQVMWHGRRLSPEQWKHVFSAALKKQEVVPNLDGSGFVVLGQSTSQMSVAEMNDLQTLIEAFGAEHNVDFSEHTEAKEPAARAA